MKMQTLFLVIFSFGRVCGLMLLGMVCYRKGLFSGTCSVSTYGWLLAIGILFGKYMLAGLLAGSLVSGVQMAISASNTGGAWDNAKKYISKGAMNVLIAREEPEMVDKSGKVNTKKSQIFKAAVTGDTVGDPFKDTAGPSLHVLIKLLSTVSLVLGPLFISSSAQAM